MSISSAGLKLRPLDSVLIISKSWKYKFNWSSFWCFDSTYIYLKKNDKNLTLSVLMPSRTFYFADKFVTVQRSLPCIFSARSFCRSKNTPFYHPLYWILYSRKGLLLLVASLIKSCCIPFMLFNEEQWIFKTVS